MHKPFPNTLHHISDQKSKFQVVPKGRMPEGSMHRERLVAWYGSVEVVGTTTFVCCVLFLPFQSVS